MTIGEKLINLRNAAGMSQDALAEALSVSRQSVSKWETDQVQPQIEKVLQICKLFNIHTPVMTLQPDVEFLPGVERKQAQLHKELFEAVPDTVEQVNQLTVHIIEHFKF